MTTINYTGLERVKEYIIGTVAPKYFNMDEVNDLNVGLLGMNTEIHANTTEDVFNALSMYVKEAFPNLAQLPESLYNYAATLDIDELFATPSYMKVALIIKENDIITKGTPGVEIISFTLDRELVVDISGIPFSPDYNINITAKPHRGDYIYTAQYDMVYQNSVSDEKIPYLKTVKMTIDNTRYLGIIINKARQVSTIVQDEVILNNDVINNTTITVEYQDELAGFDVMYRAPGATQYVLMTKKVNGGTPLKVPFCFYKLKDDNSYEISFTMMDSYFQPEFNGDIKIITYTTKGEAGNFSAYTGTNITAAPSSETYDYNNSIVVLASPHGASVGGRSAIGIEDLRSLIVERWASSGAYNIENDLQLYLENYTRRNKTNVLFVKKRDDLIERLFSSFALFKDNMGDYFPSNTLYLKLFDDDFDNSFEQQGRSTINAGSIFTYDGSSKTTAVRVPNKKTTDTFNESEFAYTNPFVVSIQRSPSIVGFYLNSINKTLPLDYTNVNTNSYYQFIANSITIKRDSIKGEGSYKVSGTFFPATQLPVELISVPDGSPEGTKPDIFNRIKIIVSITDNEIDLCYKEMTVTDITEDGMIYAECLIETTDTITQDEKILMTNMLDVETGEPASRIVPMVDCVLNFFTLFRYDEPIQSDMSVFKISGYSEYTMTNKYSTISEPVDFMVPMNIIRSKCKYVQYTKEDGELGYYYLIDLVPLLKYDAVNDPDSFNEFVTNIHTIHTYLSDIVNSITSNYNIDMKFYNTYGRSTNFSVDEDARILDRVNMSIDFKVTPKIGSDVDSLVPRLKAYIKEYIESANIFNNGATTKGYNAIYISNLMRGIENTFIDEINYHKFVRINNYDSSVQVIENKTVDMSTLSQEERRSYVPEYLTINIDDIGIDLVYK